jgi:hypothetical protein
MTKESKATQQEADEGDEINEKAPSLIKKCRIKPIPASWHQG